MRIETNNNKVVVTLTEREAQNMKSAINSLLPVPEDDPRGVTPLTKLFDLLVGELN